MKMYIHSSYGVLECVPMELQAIEKSIPEHEPTKEDTEVGESVAVPATETTTH